MSDRFKFRVWLKKEQCYIENDADICEITHDGELVCIDWGDGDTIPKTEYAFDDCVVEQCTGEKDQFGKIVFEGDIVDQYSPMEDCRRRCVVEWGSEAGGGYVCRYLDGKGNPCAHGNSEGTYFDGAYCVVVGNIHDGASNAESSVPQGEDK